MDGNEGTVLLLQLYYAIASYYLVLNEGFGPCLDPLKHCLSASPPFCHFVRKDEVHI